ncbi:MAG TPA: fasciclin domain-containing protein [Chthonomonas sp.]|jgi:uncharacterized surface protein with fasciclin (FAS1) repeats|nr:fasciclin domain-containing protein [Chthonomonas sp.]HLH80133.1 fasciclin domain-containing protein [Chthonomonas sp.]
MKTVRLYTLAIAGTALALGLTAGYARPSEPGNKPLMLCSLQDQDDSAQKPNIVEIAEKNDQFSTLVKAIQAAGLTETLEGPGPFTVFAPTNEAFEHLIKKIGQKKFDAILHNKEALTAILTYHVVPGKVMSEDVLKLKNGSKVKTVEGSNIVIHHGKKGVFVDNAKVIKTDIEASNGVIHVINAVILPPDLKSKMAGAK